MEYRAPLPQNRPPLTPAAFLSLPLGAVRPRGWLLKQLEVQAAGISGHLDEYWADVGRVSGQPTTGWLGGSGDDWERAPYYCDGLLPLAYLLDAAGSPAGPRLVAKAHQYVSWMLNSRRPNGYFGPSNPDWWPRMVAIKVLMAYCEVTYAPQALALMTDYFRYMNDMLDSMPLFVWGAARGSDNLLAVHWLYNLTGDEFLLELGKKIQRQTMDWPALQGRYEVEAALGRRQFRGNMGTHVVNNAQGIKTGAEWYVQTGDAWHRQAPGRSIENLMKYHGQPNGIWSGDEHLNGTAPTSGTELCAVAEYMYSLEELLRILGDAEFGDRLEWAAYNAFPGAFSADMWAHQYDQQVNQVLANVAQRGWTDNGDDANIFGQTPNFGCCQANFHQGWPKLVRSMVMGTPDNGLAVVAWGPCEARVSLPGGPVTLTVETDYPFSGKAVVHVGLPTGAARMKFPLLLRIPIWADRTEVDDNGRQHRPAPGTYLRLEREWSDGDQITLRFPMSVRSLTGHNGLLSIFRGPLLFGLHMGEEWVQTGGALPAGDWEVFPATPWNYGLAIDPQLVEEAFRVETRPSGAVPFASDAAPVTLKVKARRIPSWGLQNNSAGEIGVGPHKIASPLEEISLIPYGSTCLRIAAFPLVEKG